VIALVVALLDGCAFVMAAQIDVYNEAKVVN
jgi:hypothetical protein